MQRFAGKLKDSFLLMEPARPTPAHFEPEAQRLTDARLDAMAAAQPSLRQVQEVTEVRYTDRLMDDPLRDSSARASLQIALEVVDLRAAVAALRASGIGFLDPRPSRGTGNTLSVFLDPSGTGGTLIELVQQIRVQRAS